MAYLNSLNQIRSVNWGKKHLWDIQFPEGPSPIFNNWFPATEVEVTEAVLDTYSVEYYNQMFEVPMSTGLRELRVTFFDDAKFTLFFWFRKWVNNEILNLNQTSNYISRLEKSVKSVNLLKLDDTRKTILESKSYLVYPKLTLSWEGTSTPEAQQYQIPFIIAGELSASS